ncbi:hypothetical protein TNCV_2088231 [Trichonephila clavipes]|nr:hypothetical protein TNCV_2088231 [Trichonephila clavipes]
MTDPDYTPAATLDQFWQRMEAAWSAVSQEHIQSLFESMPRRVAADISGTIEPTDLKFGRHAPFIEQRPPKMDIPKIDSQGTLQKLKWCSR